MSVAAADHLAWQPPRAVDRRLAGILCLSVVLHTVAAFVLREPAEPPLPPPLLVTLRPLAVPPVVAPQPIVETPSARASRVAPALPPKARQSVTREEPRPARVLASAGPATAVAPAAPESAPPAAPAEPAPVAAPAVAAVSAAAAAEAASAALSSYRRQLTELFARPHEYPRIAALRGWEGEVRVRLKVARKGNLLGVQLDRSSGFEVLDRDALAMLEGYGQLPPLPEAIEGSEISVVVPIAYRLKKTT